MKWGLFVALLALPISVSAATIAAPSCTISTPPGTIQAGATTRIIWYTENAAHAYINGIGEVALQGYRDVRPNVTTTYPMTVSNTAGTRSCTVTVQVAAAPSLLYYTSPQPYVYSPNQIFWAPLPRSYNADYVTEEWYPDTTNIYWNDIRSGTIDSKFIPGSSYTLENTYTYPNGNYYQTLEHCIAGLDCVTVRSEQGWAYTEEVINETPTQSSPVPTIELSQQTYSQIDSPTPGIIIDPSPAIDPYIYPSNPDPSPFNNYVPTYYEEPIPSGPVGGDFYTGPSEDFNRGDLNSGVYYTLPVYGNDEFEI